MPAVRRAREHGPGDQAGLRRQTRPGPAAATRRAARAASGSRLRSMSPAGLAILTATVLALALRLFLVTRPGFLTSGTVEYDDGVYLGAALRLLHGALPYKDYAFVQPPGIIVVALPGAAARVADLAGDRAGGGPHPQRPREHRLRPARRAARHGTGA